jgi:Fe-S cluster assembly ATP-binding protein
MLSIKNLHASIEDKEILKGINLEIKAGEVHAIMGPNGSGKSTTGYVLSGREGYQVTQGSVSIGGENLLDLSVEERAKAGLFLAFQYPIELPGVSNMVFLKAAVDSHRSHHHLPELTAREFLQQAKSAYQKVKLPIAFLKRGVNEGFSGGEKKRNEILQMLLIWDGIRR